MGTPGFSVKCQCKESGYVEWTLSTWHYLLKSNVLVGGNIYKTIVFLAWALDQVLHYCSDHKVFLANNTKYINDPIDLSTFEKSDARFN